MAELKKGSRVTGGERDKLAADLKKRYEAGRVIRLLAESSGRSYGFVHRILNESGATPARPRRRHPQEERLARSPDDRAGHLPHAGGRPRRCPGRARSRGG